jgi:hypothetical protein
MLLCFFSALASYRLFLEGFEDIVAEGLEAIIAGEGRAPDQFRILPYLLLGLIREFSSSIGVEGWKIPILLFETLSLFAAACFLRPLFRSRKEADAGILLLLLVYPFLMFDGVRSIAAFILFQSSMMLTLFHCGWNGLTRKLGFVVALVLFSLTRADIALLVGLVCAICMGLRVWEIVLLVSIPVITQLILSNVVFPEAEYYSALIMLAENLTFNYLLNNPLSYLLAGLLLLRTEAIKEFLRGQDKSGLIICCLMLAYFVTVLVIGRPNEYRLFLPFLPILLLLRKRMAGNPD